MLLHELIAVLDGGLETQVPALIARTEAALKVSDSGLSGAATSLKIEVLSFLGLFFRTHQARTFSDELATLVPLLVAAVNDKFNKIAAEAFLACADLVKVLRPLPSTSPLGAGIGEPLKMLYDATMKRLASTDADEEVKGKGIKCLGVLLFNAGDVLEADYQSSLGFLRERLLNEVSRLVTVKVVGEIAQSPVCQGALFDAWIQECLVEVSALLRKVNRPLKVAAFNCIAALLERSGAGLPTTTAQALVGDLQPLVNDEDINLLPMALHTIASLLQHDPSIAKQIKKSIMPRIFILVQSPLLQGPSLEGLLAFFRDYVRAGAEAAPLVSTLAETANAAKKTVDASGTQAGMQALASSSRCIGVIIREAPAVAEGVVADYAAKIEANQTSTPVLILGLLTLGEIGRSVDFAEHPKTFARIIEHFSAASEDVRRSAAFAAGNIAVGNPTAFIPAILKLIQGDNKKRYLALQALKEVRRRCLSVLSSLGAGHHPLGACEARRDLGLALDAAVRELPGAGGGHAQCRCRLSWPAHGDGPRQVPPAAAGASHVRLASHARDRDRCDPLHLHERVVLVRRAPGAAHRRVLPSHERL